MLLCALPLLTVVCWSKQYQCVLNVCKGVLALKSDSAEADMLPGEALEQMGDSAGAAKALRAGIVANPAQPRTSLWTWLSLMDREQLVGSRK